MSETWNSEATIDEMEVWIGAQVNAGLDYARTRTPITMDAKAVVRKPSLVGVNDFADRITGMASTADVTSFLVEDMTTVDAANSIILAAAIDAIKIRELGGGHTTEVSNGLISRTIGRLGMRTAIMNYGLADYDKLLQFYSDYGMLAEDIVERDKPFVSWGALKSRNYFVSALESTRILRRWDQLEVLGEAEYQQLKEANNNLWQASKILQKYGVKPVIAPAINQTLAKDWLFEDPRERLKSAYEDDTYNRNLNYTYGIRPVAEITGVNAKLVTSMPKQTVRVGVNSNTISVQRNTTDMIDGDGKEADPYRIMLLNDGHLAMANGLRLDQIADETNAQSAYEQLRSELLAIYFDLVTPVYVDEIVTGVVKEFQVSDPDPRGRLRNLILAREKVLRVLGEDIVKEIDDELEKGARLSLVEHDVIGHIRTIRPTFRAHDEARRRCREDLGIELADYGETYVRNHKRGQVVEVEPKGHVAVFVDGEVANRKKHQGRITPKGVQPQARRKKKSRR